MIATNGILSRGPPSRGGVRTNSSVRCLGKFQFAMSHALNLEHAISGKSRRDTLLPLLLHLAPAETRSLPMCKPQKNVKVAIMASDRWHMAFRAMIIDGCRAS